MQTLMCDLGGGKTDDVRDMPHYPNATYVCMDGRKINLLSHHVTMSHDQYHCTGSNQQWLQLQECTVEPQPCTLLPLLSTNFT